MFEDALKAKIPVIGVHTDDPINVQPVLQSIAKRTVAPFPANTNFELNPNLLYVSKDTEAVTEKLYTKLVQAEAQAVVVNPKPGNPLIFDAGPLRVPDHFIKGYLKSFVAEEDIPSLMPGLHGLSIKAASEIVQLAMVKSKAITPAAIKKVRLALEGNVSGLDALDTDFDFYLPCPELMEWLELNDKYFLNPSTPPQLTPRGVILSGIPGVGKSMAARYIGKHWNVPVFRLDLTAALSKYIGESEHQIAKVLRSVDEHAPCVLLIDEMEKLFGEEGDNGTTQRILSQILWWLQTRSSKVIVVMTTNKIASIPAEVYRKGRIDRHIVVPPLSLNEARLFVASVYESVMGEKPHPYRVSLLKQALEETNLTHLPHAMAEEIAHDTIKRKGWALKSMLSETLKVS